MSALEDSDAGAVIHASPPYEPATEGRIERTVQRVISKTRVGMINAGIPIQLWPEIVVAAVILHNYTANSRGRVPEKVWREFVEKRQFTPDISSLRTLGARCVVTMTDHERTSKVASRACEGILVGFEGEHIYRIFVPLLSRVVQSSHFKIWENITLEEGDWMRS